MLYLKFLKKCIKEIKLLSFTSNIKLLITRKLFIQIIFQIQWYFEKRFPFLKYVVQKFEHNLKKINCITTYIYCSLNGTNNLNIFKM